MITSLAAARPRLDFRNTITAEHCSNKIRQSEEALDLFALSPRTEVEDEQKHSNPVQTSVPSLNIVALFRTDALIVPQIATLSSVPPLLLLFINSADRDAPRGLRFLPPAWIGPSFVPFFGEAFGGTEADNVRGRETTSTETGRELSRTRSLTLETDLEKGFRAEFEPQREYTESLGRQESLHLESREIWTRLKDAWSEQ